MKKAQPPADSLMARPPMSGSMWVAARADLDTAINKLDSRIVDPLTVIEGPYSARYGPEFSHIVAELVNAKRFEDGIGYCGSTSLDYRTNGRAWYGRQSLEVGAENWGTRVDYGHRTGSDYFTGNDFDVPASFHSRYVHVAAGYDPAPDHRLDFHYLRLDQTDVELPGQAFDINALGTNGFEVKYVVQDQPYFDQSNLEAWYNQTHLSGDAQRPGKRRMFEIYRLMGFEGVTYVDSACAGFSWFFTWGDEDGPRLRAGFDTRMIEQELNEFTSGDFFGFVWDNANSPIPRSQYVNPGVFVEWSNPILPDLSVTCGARADVTHTAVTEDAANLAAVGTDSASVPAPLVPVSFADIVGTDDFDHSHLLLAAYLTGRYDINCCWAAEAGIGYAERAPTLTELYAAQPFMFLLQNGLNTVTGDPLLNPERLLQVDLGLKYDNGYTRLALTGFHAWVFDYITFENLAVFPNPQLVEQVQLKYVNTDLATLAGGELLGELDATDWVTVFAAASYVDGRDRTRNGSFATKQASPGARSERDPTESRGYYSGKVGAAEEPLPGIAPLESRIGFRVHEPGARPRWSTELSVRLVDDQDRVATSLFEQPSPGFAVWDARAYWQARDNLLFVIGVENFTNRNYREHFDFHPQPGSLNRTLYQPGINFYFGTELTY